ncbi:hypothetical protein NE237_025852 [Protea cynaroides]|uniref:DUF7642 domain-containing protein n=1 Tax=Protea cynaroides TaxID=273540 RepID=A0A9Q0K0L1_9MAGN|nr:hypothetical protein NE237_025852 [Protea cynaroides]
MILWSAGIRLYDYVDECAIDGCPIPWAVRYRSINMLCQSTLINRKVIFIMSKLVTLKLGLVPLAFPSDPLSSREENAVCSSGVQMGSRDGVVEIDFLERRLLPDSGSTDVTESDHEVETVLYSASFQEFEDNYVKYQTTIWILYSLLLILAWGIGLFMLLYIPVRRYVLRKDIQSRRLYVTPNAIVYKVTRPVPFPCCGVLKKEKYVLLPSVADVIVEQGYLQSLFGVYSIRIENAGVRRPPSDDVQIQGVADPRAFRKAVLSRLSNVRSENFSRQVSRNEESFGIGHSSTAWARHNVGASITQPMSPSKSFRQDSFPSAGELILQKLEEVGTSVKRVQSLIEEQHCQKSDTIDETRGF